MLIVACTSKLALASVVFNTRSCMQLYDDLSMPAPRRLLAALPAALSKLVAPKEAQHWPLYLICGLCPGSSPLDQ